MGFSDIIKKSVLEGFNTDFSTTKMVVTLAITFIIALYIFFIYKYVTRSTFYNKNFNVSMAIIAVITAGIVLAMQSNLVISLGMVGALSIVRFRTAIKEPMDLLFLFWSIGTGIICGASLYSLAIIMSLVATAGIFVLQIIPATKSPLLLVVKMTDISKEEQVLTAVKNAASKYEIDSKSIAKGQENLIINLKTDKASELVNELAAIEGVASATVLHHEGEVKH